MIDRNIQFEMRGFGNEGEGILPDHNPEVRIESLRDIAAAKGKAGRFAKQINGPVDLAYAGDEPWNERYLTTAAPSIYHKSGYRFERLS